MEWMTRLNVLHEKITGLLQVVSKLKAENEDLEVEVSLLNEQIAELKGKLGDVETTTTQYLTERDAIKDRVERLIQMIE